MIGQLQDAGNTVTLAHYLELLNGAGMLAGLPKYAIAQVRQRGSSPKLQVLNTALMTVQSNLSFEEARRNGDFWGRLVEAVSSKTQAPDRPSRSLSYRFLLSATHLLALVNGVKPRIICSSLASAGRRQAQRFVHERRFVR